MSDTVYTISDADDGSARLVGKITPAPGGGGGFPFTGDAVIDGTLVVDSQGAANASTFTASTDFNGDGLGVYVFDLSGETRINVIANRVEITDGDFNDALVIRDGPEIGFFGSTVTAQPVVPLTSPTVQDVIDALVALGLVAQHD